MELSVVIPVYNEEESLPQLFDEIDEALGKSRYTYEIICVDDGSTDRSYQVLTTLAESHPNLTVCRFRRNFGQTAALQAGFDVARGQVVATMDADLQNDPRDIPKMVERLEEGHDLVAGWRADRKDAFLNRRLPSMLANKLISATTTVRLHDYGCTLKAIRADVCKQLRLYGEMHRFIPAMASWIGADVCEMKVNHRARSYGRSKYGIGRTVRVVLDLLTVLFLRSYLVRPMQVFGLAGFVSGFAGFVICAVLAVQKIFYGASLANRPLLLLGAILMLVGVQLVSLGLVADVVARTYHEAQNKRPYYVRDWILPKPVETREQNTASSPGTSPHGNVA